MLCKPVYIKTCENYSSLEIKEIVKNIVESAAININKDDIHRKILLKPNLLTSAKPKAAITTHPEFVKGVGEYFLELGANLGIGDSPANHRKIETVWSTTGMSEAAESLGVDLLRFADFGTYKFKLKSGKNFLEIPVYNVHKNYNVINLAKMKTHNLMGFTGAVKNLYGFVAGFAKANCHKYLPSAFSFADVLVALYREIKPQFNIVDAIVSMEGNGPAGGDPCKTELIIAGEDALTIDIVLAELMGIKRNRDPMFNAFRRAGIDVPSINDIPIYGDKTSIETLENFKLSRFSAIYNVLPEFLVKRMAKLFWIYPKARQDLCILCGACVKACPVEAITMEAKQIIVDKTKCISCFCCTEICPEKAFMSEMSFLAKLFVSK